jgi:membrane protein required for colicin V production
MTLPAGMNWYDWVVVVALLYGLWSGMRTGLSGELLRVLSLMLMVAVAVFFYEPVGRWVQRSFQLAAEPANLVAFVGLAVAVYVIMLAVRLALHKHLTRLPMAAVVENCGGAVAGLIRVAVLLVVLTVTLCLTRSEFWHTQVGKNSRFGAAVVRQLPAVEAITQKQFPETVWFLKEINRPKEPDFPDTENTNRR